MQGTDEYTDWMLAAGEAEQDRPGSAWLLAGLAILAAAILLIA